MTTVTDDAGVNEFLRLVVEARNSGVRALSEDWFAGWTPKKPSEQEALIAMYVAKCKPEERKALLNCVRYFTDLSFFKLLNTLEEGTGELEFELLMRARTTGETSSLINPEEDNAIRRKYFSAVSSEGQ